MAVITEQQVEPRLAIIIPYFDGAQFIARCLNSIRQGSMSPAHLYIVDNDTTGLPDQSSTFAGDNITLIRTRPAIGFGRAANVGISSAIKDGYTLFVILNQDTYLDPRCIESMVLCHASAVTPALITTMIYDYETNALSPHFIKYILEEQTSYFEDLAHNTVKQTYPLSRIGAACILFDMRLYSAVSLFDPLFHMYGEDNDLCMRIKHAGGELLLATNARVHHYHSLVASKGMKKARIDRWLATSRMQLRIRYKGLTPFGYMVRSVLYFIKTSLGLHEYHISPYIFLSTMPRILSQWSALKSVSPDQVQNRIELQVKQDRL